MGYFKAKLVPTVVESEITDMTARIIAPSTLDVSFTMVSPNLFHCTSAGLFHEDMQVYIDPTNAQTDPTTGVYFAYYFDANTVKIFCQNIQTGDLVAGDFRNLTFELKT